MRFIGMEDTHFTDYKYSSANSTLSFISQNSLKKNVGGFDE